MKNALFFSLIFSCFFFSMVHAQPYLLHSGFDARSAGMGVTGISGKTAIGIIFRNPAGLAFAEERIGIAVTFAGVSRDMSILNTGVYFKPDSVSAIGIVSGSATIEQFASSYSTGKSTESSTGVCYTHRLGGHFSAFVAGYYSQSGQESPNPAINRNYWSGDAGFFYRGKTRHPGQQLSSRFSAGIAACNLGKMPGENSSFYYESYSSTSAAIRSGIGIEFCLHEIHHLNIELESNQFFRRWNHVNETTIGTGLEYVYGNRLAVRTGYTYGNYWNRMINLGTGVRFGACWLDLAYRMNQYNFRGKEGEWRITLRTGLNNLKLPHKRSVE